LHYFFFSKKFFRLTQLTQLYENVTINFDEKIHWEQDILNFLHSEKNLCDYPFYHMLQECSDNYSKFQLFLKKELDMEMESIEFIQTMTNICSNAVETLSNEQMIIFVYFQIFKDIYYYQHVKTLRMIRKSELGGDCLMDISFEKFLEILGGPLQYEEEDRDHLTRIYKILRSDDN